MEYKIDARKVRQLLYKAVLTEEDLSYCANLDQCTIDSIWRGGSCTWLTVVSIAAALDVLPEELVIFPNCEAISKDYF